MNRLFPLEHSDKNIKLPDTDEALDVSFEAFSVGSSGGPSIDRLITKKKIQWVVFLSIVVFGVFTVKSAYLQVVQGSHLRIVAEENRTRTIVNKATRGVIYDSEGVQLVQNSPSFALMVTPIDLPKDSTERQELIRKAADLGGINPTDIDVAIAEFEDSYNEPIPITTELTYNEAMGLYLLEERLPGVSIEMVTLRQYETTPLQSLSHVLGYTGIINKEEYERLRSDGYRRTDNLGKQGLELSYETTLRGTHGTRTVEVNALGHEAALIKETYPEDGKNIHLKLDLELTRYIEERLDAFNQKMGYHRASVVVLDPRDGGVRALVSIPGYDNNLFSGGIELDSYQGLLDDPNKPLFPRAVSGEFPPGSTFKPVVGAIALEEGLINASTSFLSTGGLSVNVWFFPDWKGGGHGITNIRKAIAESVNTFFYIIGGGFGDFRGLGVEKITEMAKHFGLASKTGIDLPQEGDGFLPTKSWKQEVKGERWYVGDTYHAAIGQGDILVTPIQLALTTATFANGGTLFEPHILDWVGGSETREDHTAVVRNEQVVSEEHIRTIQQGLRDTVFSGSGSARSLQTLPIQVAGKTGTAQIGGDRENHAWFTSYGPFDRPELVVTVLVEEAGQGSTVSVPIARDIYQWWYDNRIR